MIMQTLVMTVFILLVFYTAIGAWRVGQQIQRLEAMVKALNYIEEAYEADEITAIQAIYLVRTYLHTVMPHEFTQEVEAQLYDELEAMQTKKVKRKIKI